MKLNRRHRSSGKACHVTIPKDKAHETELYAYVGMVLKIVSACYLNVLLANKIK